MIVYLDGVIGLNFLIDLFLLIGVNRLAGFPAAFSKAAAGALIGGGYAGLCLIPGLTFLSSILWKSVSFGLICATVFGVNRGALRRAVLFVLLSMCLGGIALFSGANNSVGMVLCAALLAVLCHFGWNRMPSQPYLIVTASYCGRKTEFLAMLDTGNQLTDPMTGEPVLIVSKRIGSILTGVDEKVFTDGVNALLHSKIAGCRLIPYQAVGKERGFLLGIRCDCVVINGRNADRMIAISPNDFGGGEFDGLAGRNYV